MRYFLDTEFNGFGGKLISLALVGDNGRELYVATDCHFPGEWVKKNVLPIIKCEGAEPIMIDHAHFGQAIAIFLQGDPEPAIVTDWPDDVRFFCESVVTGPGQMVAIPRLLFDVVRVDAYPTELPGAIEHNALWDARALKYRMTMCGPSAARREDLRKGIVA